ncbi:Thermitase [Verticillium dahliae VDG1]|nr:Thermitase [Verticillium dahliae VDG1]
MATQSPPTRPLSSRRSTASSKGLSLDLSSLPPLTQPTPPSNTLLLTNLDDLAIFRPDNLQTIRDLIAQTAAIHSPPHGWEMKLEDAPNKQVHAEDLADALAKLHHASRSAAPGVDTPVSPVDGTRQTRSRSSTLLYQPDAHEGASPDLPAICLEDMTDEPSPIEAPKPIMAHTSRPPVELMHHA